MIKLLIRIEKARRGGHLVPEKRTVTRAGRSFQMTVWVSPEDSEARHKKATEYKAPEAIKNHMAKQLKLLGYEVSVMQSGLSDSKYIEANLPEGDTVKIRISDHDLPPSYDKLHGEHDFDIIAGDKQRGGNAGTASYYPSAILSLARKAGKPIPDHEKKILEGWKAMAIIERKNAERLMENNKNKNDAIKERAKKREKTKEWLKEKEPEIYRDVVRRERDILNFTGNKKQKAKKRLNEILDHAEIQEDKINKNTGVSKSLTFSGWKLQGRMKFQGLQVSVENRKGTYRTGINDKGRKWRNYMHYPYGYIRGTVGKDKDHLDCYIGPNKESNRVFIVHQNNPETGKYDEDKVMLGWNTPGEAKKAYLGQYDSPKFFGSMEETDIDTFKEKALNKNNHGKKLTTRS